MKKDTITTKELFERLVAFEAKVDLIDKTNNRTISVFRVYSLLAIILVIIDIVIDLLHFVSP